MNYFYCEQCEHYLYRNCKFCSNKVCFYCQELCICEKIIDRTSLFIRINGILKICNVDCFIFFVKCNSCSKNFCSNCDIALYCNKCQTYYCSDCREFKYCKTCKETHCNGCENMVHCDECNYNNCIFCKNTLICEYCFTGMCDTCSYDTVTSKKIYRCSLCMSMKCTSCSELEVCGYCCEIICKECASFCNDRCPGIGIHCKLCVFHNVNCNVCQCKICESCNKICNMCNNVMCLKCFDNDNMYMCKFCTWYKLKRSDNILNKTFPNEIIDLIGHFYLHN